MKYSLVPTLSVGTREKVYLWSVVPMNREETLEWIDLILDSLDQHEMMAIIRESVGEFDGEFFETISSETERHEAEGDGETAGRLTQIARAIASVRQNRAENL